MEASYIEGDRRGGEGRFMKTGCLVVRFGGRTRTKQLAVPHCYWRSWRRKPGALRLEPGIPTGTARVGFIVIRTNQCLRWILEVS